MRLILESLAQAYRRTHGTLQETVGERLRVHAPFGSQSVPVLLIDNSVQHENENNLARSMSNRIDMTRPGVPSKYAAPIKSSGS